MGGSVVFRVSGATHVLEGFAVLCRVRRSPLFFFCVRMVVLLAIPRKSQVKAAGVENPKP